MKRNFLYNLILLVVVVIFTLLSAEVILRTTHLFGARTSFTKPDDKYGWRFVPLATYWYNNASGKINRYGWRDVAWELNKALGVYRVAIVGDSFVEAFQVPLADTFHKIAEKQLNSNGYQVELMSFGQSGFTTTEEFLIIRDEVLTFKPDLVVLFFYPANDLADINKDIIRSLHPYFSYDETTSTLKLDTSFNQTSNYKIK